VFAIARVPPNSATKIDSLVDPPLQQYAAYRYQLNCSALPTNNTQRRRRSPTVGAALHHCTTFHKCIVHKSPVNIRYVKKKFSAMVILTNILSRYLDEMNKERGDQVAV
jgi:hypothetical protein